MSRRSKVRVVREEVVIPTYLPAPPDRYPMFLEKRVYQGSSGKVYPLPFTDRIAETKTDRRWQAVRIENEYLRVVVLPEIGGRIHSAEDRTNGYDFIYRQDVIKPALVGLAGPWISGGIEFNWPQHHRPGTFLPVEVHIEEDPDGSATVWLGDHDPISRMKGMHGVCLRPGKAFIELKVRAHNRTPFVQTFLWWANAAVRVHEAYQSFFPPDVAYVADHARRAMSEYPLCRGTYYGVDYGARVRRGTPEEERPPGFVPPHCGGTAPVDYAPNDLSWYANIPTPCSYMCVGSKEDFFGGYDHFRGAGVVHIADHHIAPGKKQWTWGNHPFGYAWDRNLTDAGGPYIELMAGVYTDNQPDFSFLHPGETRTWSQYWYPIQGIGPARRANLDAAVGLTVRDGRVRFGASVTTSFPGASVVLSARGKRVASFRRDLAPGAPFVSRARLPRGTREADLRLRVADREGRELISFEPAPRGGGGVPSPATEPPAPRDMESADELYITGLHLEQYRHATRSPTAYWLEALRRDPLDARSRNALGLWRLHRGEFVEAEAHFRRAIERLIRRNSNPRDGEPHYNLGLALRYSLDARDEPGGGTSRPEFEEACDAFHKAAWSGPWAGAAALALAEMDCRRADWRGALGHLDRSLRLDADHLRARDLKALVLGKLGRGREAGALLGETLGLDPLDAWARHLAGRFAGGLGTRLDIAHDCARAGLYQEAIEVLEGAPEAPPRDLPDGDLGAGPLAAYTLAWLWWKEGDPRKARSFDRKAAALLPHHCFPARLEEIAILRWAMGADPRDARAPYYLGNLLYDRRRHEEAIRLWERAAALDPRFPVAWRNLGLGSMNVLRQPAKARAAYEKAFRAAPGDARLLHERDQLWKRLGEPPARRLLELEAHRELVRRRDDLSVELCALYNQTGRHEEALAVLEGRRFQPWEGGEGQALGQHVRTHLALGRRALSGGDPAAARGHFQAALESPANLGEAKHLLADQGDIHYWLACALLALGEKAKAREHWRAAAASRGDFQEMSVRRFSERTYYSALSWERLGKRSRARELLGGLLDFARELRRSKAGIDYFATSLPASLLFEDDLRERRRTTALFLEAQAYQGLGRRARSLRLLRTVLRRDPNHPLARDLLEETLRPRPAPTIRRRRRR